MNQNLVLVEFLIMVGVLLLWLCSKPTFFTLLMKLMWDNSAGAARDEAQLCSELATRAEH